MTQPTADQTGDIASRDDISSLIVEFYTRAYRDELLQPMFVDVAQMDLAAHLPVMCDFWTTVLFGARIYHGGAYAPHARLHALSPLTSRHFERWLAIWERTVDDMYAGDVADTAKDRARSIAQAFHARLTNPARSPVSGYPYAVPDATQTSDS